jgi:hypothetical protein
MWTGPLSSVRLGYLVENFHMSISGICTVSLYSPIDKVSLSEEISMSSKTKQKNLMLKWRHFSKKDEDISGYWKCQRASHCLKQWRSVLAHMNKAKLIMTRLIKTWKRRHVEGNEPVAVTFTYADRVEIWTFPYQLIVVFQVHNSLNPSSCLFGGQHHL